MIDNFQEKVQQLIDEHYEPLIKHLVEHGVNDPVIWRGTEKVNGSYSKDVIDIGGRIAVSIAYEEVFYTHVTHPSIKTGVKKLSRTKHLSKVFASYFYPRFKHGGVHLIPYLVSSRDDVNVFVTYTGKEPPGFFIRYHDNNKFSCQMRWEDKTQEYTIDFHNLSATNTEVLSKASKLTKELANVALLAYPEYLKQMEG